MNLDNASWELLVSIDRSDRSAAVCYLQNDGNYEEEVISLEPEAMEAWWERLRATGLRLAVAFEQPAPNLLAFFVRHQPVVIYALNPSATYSYRRSHRVSRSRTDGSDAYHQALFVEHRSKNLPVWTPPAESIAVLERLNIGRRKCVEQRIVLTNRLQAALKRYFPQALELLHEDLWRPINLEFLRKWPCPTKLRFVPRSRLRAFYTKHGSRSEARWEKRANLIDRLVPLAPASEADLLDVATILDQIEVLNEAVLKYEDAIRKIFEKEGAKAEQVAALPGAGPALAPRLYVALAKYAPQCPTAQDLAAAVGVAPVTDQSGKMKRVYRRLQCDNHTRQSFIEWAKEAWKHSTWAHAFVRHRQEKHQPYNAIIRALAYKWIRILWKCWHEGFAYDENRYIERLRSKGSPLILTQLAPPKLL